MKRRQFVAALLAASAGQCCRTACAKEVSLSDPAPEKIRLIPDDYRIRNVGRLSDGRLFFADAQLDYASGIVRHFICMFLFDPAGTLVEHSIELLGVAGSYPEQRAIDAKKRHLDALGDRITTDIWVRPFGVEAHGAVFGLIPRQGEDGGWVVDFMPGNTLLFYPPWEEGGYDT